MKSSEKKARELYDLQSKIYGQGSIQQMNVEIPTFASLIEENNLFHGSVVDVGVGTGQLTNTLLSHFKNNDVTVSGFDISPNNVSAFKEFQVSDSRICCADIASFYDTPYEAESFDLAVSNHVLHYAEDLNSAMQEVRRILKPRAHFIFSSVVCEKSSAHNIIDGVLMHDKIPEPIRVWAYQRSREDILAAANNAGFLLMPFDNGSFFKEFWPSYYYYRSRVPDTPGAVPHTFVSIAQKVDTVPLQQTLDSSFSEGEFKVQVEKVGKILKTLGFTISAKADFDIPEWHNDLENARGEFTKHAFTLSTKTSYEDQLFFLLHSVGHLAQWKIDPHEEERGYKFDKTLKTTKNLDEHYLHETDSVRYSLDFMVNNGLERYFLWFVKYFIADQKYLTDYVFENRERIGYAFFEKILKSNEVLELSADTSAALLRKNFPDITVDFSVNPGEPILFI